jgi:hypothetical protein
MIRPYIATLAIQVPRVGLLPPHLKLREDLEDDVPCTFASVPPSLCDVTTSAIRKKEHRLPINVRKHVPQYSPWLVLVPSDDLARGRLSI